MTASGDVTRLLLDWNRGDRAALDQLMPLVYDELRRLAEAYMRQESKSHTLQPTALVHEAYLRLIDQHQVQWQNRAQFLGVAAQMMRRILVDHARRRRSAKRESSRCRVTLDKAMDFSKEQEVDLVALDDALTSLAAVDPQKERIVELRFFGGLNIAETAEVLGVSPSTIDRQWRLTRAWLYNQLQNADCRLRIEKG